MDSSSCSATCRAGGGKCEHIAHLYSVLFTPFVFQFRLCCYIHHYSRRKSGIKNKQNLGIAFESSFSSFLLFILFHFPPFSLSFSFNLILLLVVRGIWALCNQTYSNGRPNYSIRWHLCIDSSSREYTASTIDRLY